MPEPATTHVRLLDVPMLDARELERLLPVGSYEKEQEELPAAEHGDLGLTAALVVLVAPQAIKAIATWAQKRRQREEFSMEVETRLADGTSKRSRVTFKRATSDAPDADVLRQLCDELELDPAVVRSLLGTT